MSEQALNRIATAIETLAAAVAELAKAKPSSGSTPRGSSFSGGPAGYDPEPTNRDGTKVGSPEDLATQYGDPEIRYIPRGWDGPDFKGLRMSQTNPSFLRWLANELGRGIDKKRAAGDDEKAGWDRKNQLRAIGWCERLGETKSAAKPDPFALTPSNARDDDAGDAFSDDDIPF